MIAAGKIFIALGIGIACAGFCMLYADNIPWIGRLPGDITIRKENVHLYAPLTTSLLFSLLVSGILWLVSYFTKK